jgi:hypothetical protein
MRKTFKAMLERDELGGDSPKTNPYLLDVLASLPAYTEVLTTFESGHKCRLMARELPGQDRRYTNLDTGTELFIHLLDDNPIMHIEVEPFKMGDEAYV